MKKENPRGTWKISDQREQVVLEYIRIWAVDLVRANRKAASARKAAP